MTGHVKETDLALYASGDLRLWQRAAVHLHVRTANRAVRRWKNFARMAGRCATRRKDFPKAWIGTRLSAEMTANIRVGLAAGECVRSAQARAPPRFLRCGVLWRWRRWSRPALAALLVSGWWLNMPAQETQALSRAMRSIWHGRERHAEERGPVIEASSDGIELRKDGGSLGVSQDSAKLVSVSVSTQGSASAHYVDQDTGQVTITSVSYAQ